MIWFWAFLIASTTCCACAVAEVRTASVEAKRRSRIPAWCATFWLSGAWSAGKAHVGSEEVNLDRRVLDQ